jgi:hypothetical protein
MDRQAHTAFLRVPNNVTAGKGSNGHSLHSPDIVSQTPEDSVQTLH